MCRDPLILFISVCGFQMTIEERRAHSFLPVNFCFADVCKHLFLPLHFVGLLPRSGFALGNGPSTLHYNFKCSDNQTLILPVDCVLYDFTTLIKFAYVKTTTQRIKFRGHKG